MEVINSGGEKVDVQSGNLKIDEANNRMTLHDGSDYRMVIGYRNPDSQGIFISKAGEDVFTSDDSELIFNSNNNLFKIVGSGTYTLVHPASTAETIGTLPHSLGFAPAFVSFVTGDSISYEQMPYINVTGGVSSLTVNRQIVMSVDNTTLYFSIKTPTNNAVIITRTIRYYLLQETAN